MRMKRIISLIIMVLYLLPALGITVSSHYCGGRLADVSLFGSKPKMSCVCGVTAPKNNVHFKGKCCEQVVYSLKLDNQQIKQSALDLKIPDPGVLGEKHSDFLFVRNQVIVPSESALSYTPDLPPGRFKEPIYIQNDSFLI